MEHYAARPGAMEKGQGQCPVIAALRRTVVRLAPLRSQQASLHLLSAKSRPSSARSTVTRSGDAPVQIKAGDLVGQATSSRRRPAAASAFVLLTAHFYFVRQRPHGADGLCATTKRQRYSISPAALSLSSPAKWRRPAGSALTRLLQAFEPAAVGRDRHAVARFVVLCRL